MLLQTINRIINAYANIYRRVFMIYVYILFSPERPQRYHWKKKNTKIINNRVPIIIVMNDTYGRDETCARHISSNCIINRHPPRWGCTEPFDDDNYHGIINYTRIYVYRYDAFPENHWWHIENINSSIEIMTKILTIEWSSKHFCSPNLYGAEEKKKEKSTEFLKNQKCQFFYTYNS
jgi:hypothetical protein